MKYRSVVAVVIGVVLIAGHSARAQELITDRPDFTESASSVPAGHFQLESGFTYERIGKAKSAALGEVLMRIGIVPRLELRLGLNSYRWTDTPTSDFSGVEDFLVGAKYELAAGSDEFRIEQPEAAVIFGTSLPTGADNYSEDDPQLDVKVPLAWTLTEEIGTGCNLNWAYAGSGGDRFHQFSWSNSLAFDVSSRIGCYAEYYGFDAEDKDGPDVHYVNGGGTYLLTEHVQLDARVGHGMNGESPDEFAGLGFSFLH